MSHARDTAALDYGLSQRALVAVSARSDDVAALITRRLAALARSGVRGLDEAAVREVVRQAVHDVRTAPPVPAGPPSDPLAAEGRRHFEALATVQPPIGELMLEVAPAYLSDTDAVVRLAVLCDVLDVTLDHALATRRYALTGDQRAQVPTSL
ncbi:hypothetical protein [Streptomyces thermolilacinus]|uniref:Uncharacterized protein n=1 Tax=Streptomyces thermolilacinus SPC6 TaxID=1306406 RepID=A0A1D3DLD1_9ACTN|nr:hypothetical protein [Streptomyces thermolilacinus]OEJ93130.1 hypothetical protein J116_000105 [Streptomyces thermolilacinus SPC6]